MHAFKKLNNGGGACLACDKHAFRRYSPGVQKSGGLS